MFLHLCLRRSSRRSQNFSLPLFLHLFVYLLRRGVGLTYGLARPHLFTFRPEQEDGQISLIGPEMPCEPQPEGVERPGVSEGLFQG